jgi:hypothetical protein
MRRRISRSRMVWVAPVALLWAAPLLGAPKEVAVRWEELAPLVEKREIETVLTNGVHLRGRVEQVLPEALVVEVKRTSDPNLVPKGPTRVSRELVSVLTVRWKRRLGRILMPIAFYVGGGIGYMALSGAMGRDGASKAEEFLIAALLVIAGYGVGDVLDQRQLAVRIVPAPASPMLSVDIRPEGEHHR